MENQKVLTFMSRTLKIFCDINKVKIAFLFYNIDSKFNLATRLSFCALQPSKQYQQPTYNLCFSRYTYLLSTTVW